jgi:hypothetical protein
MGALFPVGTELIAKQHNVQEKRMGNRRLSLQVSVANVFSDYLDGNLLARNPAGHTPVALGVKYVLRVPFTLRKLTACRTFQYCYIDIVLRCFGIADSLPRGCVKPVARKLYHTCRTPLYKRLLPPCVDHIKTFQYHPVTPITVTIAILTSHPLSEHENPPLLRAVPLAVRCVTCRYYH